MCDSLEKPDPPALCNRRSAFAFSLLVAMATFNFSLLAYGQDKQLEPSHLNAEAHVGKGYEYIQNSQFQEAAREFEEALALRPDLVKARYQLAVCYFALQQWPEARREFERLRQETKSDPSVIYYLARLDLQEENFDRVITPLEKICSDPPFPDAPYYLGSAYLKKGKLDAAEKWLKKAAELGPRDFRVPDRLARVYLKAGRRSEAEKQFTLSASLRQNYNDAARQSLECIQELTHRPLEEAQLTCRRLFDATDPDKLTTLGMIYGNQGHYAESIAPFEQAARLDPDSFEIHHNLGLSYFRLRRYTEARKSLEKAVALRPDFFSSNALLGACLYALKEDEQAYRVLDHAHQLNPQDADTAGLLFKEAVLLAEKDCSNKQFRECQNFLQKASALNPGDPAIQRRLAEVQALSSPTPPQPKKP